MAKRRSDGLATDGEAARRESTPAPKATTLSHPKGGFDMRGATENANAVIGQLNAKRAGGHELTPEERERYVAAMFFAAF